MQQRGGALRKAWEHLGYGYIGYEYWVWRKWMTLQVLRMGTDADNCLWKSSGDGKVCETIVQGDNSSGSHSFRKAKKVSPRGSRVCRLGLAWQSESKIISPGSKRPWVLKVVTEPVSANLQ
jgi:hypothetical protein